MISTLCQWTQPFPTPTRRNITAKIAPVTKPEPWHHSRKAVVVVSAPPKVASGPQPSLPPPTLWTVIVWFNISKMWSTSLTTQITATIINRSTKTPQTVSTGIRTSRCTLRMVGPNSSPTPVTATRWCAAATQLNLATPIIAIWTTITTTVEVATTMARHIYSRRIWWVRESSGPTGNRTLTSSTRLCQWLLVIVLALKPATRMQKTQISSEVNYIAL